MAVALRQLNPIYKKGLKSFFKVLTLCFYNPWHCVCVFQGYRKEILNRVMMLIFLFLRLSCIDCLFFKKKNLEEVEVSISQLLSQFLRNFFGFCLYTFIKDI